MWRLKSQNKEKPTASSSKFMGESGESWWKRQSAQSMPSMLVPEFRPSTVKSSGAPLPLGSDPLTEDMARSD